MKVSRPGFLTQLSKHHCHLSSIPLIHANLVSQKGSKMNNNFLKKNLLRKSTPRVRVHSRRTSQTHCQIGHLREITLVSIFPQEDKE